MSLKRTRKPSVLHAIGSQTPATMHAISTMGGTRGARSTTRRRKSTRSRKSGSSPKRRKSAKTGGRLKKGSPAAKAYMAKIRKKRGK